MRVYLMEFVGTFFLMLTVGSAVVPPNDAGAMAPLAIGAILVAMVSAGNHISGAQYNPAVTLSIYLRGALSASVVPGYILAQCAGALAGAVAAAFFKGTPDIAPRVVDPTFALLGEFFFTFALCTVVLNVATSRAARGPSAYPLAIGFTVLAGAYVMGPITGAAFNPAIVLGVTALGLFAPSNMWVYMLATFAAAATAAAFFRYTEGEDDQSGQRAA